ncbi:protein of unknown function [Candidatus Nitrospira inopinata]|uniref:Uncharacterized protein n=1 Tax=Candidatus Nitrospira inopinata TaxID=1715989 RepID=A0A0S4KL37_9BACT|nr:protein of unknown function [Candidatus Nitrospira inopinata]
MTRCSNKDEHRVTSLPSRQFGRFRADRPALNGTMLGYATPYPSGRPTTQGQYNNTN